jgi:arylsulfatase A-like enzyme
MISITRREFLGVAAGAAAGLASSYALPQTSGGKLRPNIVVILADDMGFSDLGCYGSEIQTPNLDKLASGGMRFTEFYNSPRCCPSRAALLTGLYSHQSGFGLMADDYGKFTAPAYRGDLGENCVTIAEALRLGGYRTAMCGKWHLTPPFPQSQHNWPLQRGFEAFYGTIGGACSYNDPATLLLDNQHIRASGDFYYTDAIAQNAVRYIDDYSRRNAPFFLYCAFTAPHWPLQAPEEEIAKYADRYKAGWDAMRAERHERMIGAKIVDRKWPLSPRDPRVPPWTLAGYKEWEQRRIAVYAAQVDRMDQGIGRILDKLKERGIFDNTLILFLSDNGGCYEELPGPDSAIARVPLFTPHETLDGRLVQVGNDPSVMPGGADTYQSYGIPWGNASNTPFRLYKHFAHEGGISTPMIAHWPALIRQGGTLTSQIGHEIDIMATCLDVAGADYPSSHRGHSILPLEGKSLLPILEGRQREGHSALFWEHEGNSAVRAGKWKLVARHADYWELYDMEEDRTEMHNLVDQYPERVKDIAEQYRVWAKRVGVEPWPLPGMADNLFENPGYLRKNR